MEYPRDGSGRIFDPDLVEVFLSRVVEVDPAAAPDTDAIRSATA